MLHSKLADFAALNRAVAAEASGAFNLDRPPAPPPTLVSETKPNEANFGAHQSSLICTNVHQSSSFDPAAKNETKPPPLTPRQLAAARLLVLGRTNRAIARELEVEVHTISRWRRMPVFVAEIERLGALALSIQLDKS